MKKSNYMWESSSIVRAIPSIGTLPDDVSKVVLNWLYFQQEYTRADEFVSKMWKNVPFLRDCFCESWKWFMTNRTVFNNFALQILRCPDPRPLSKFIPIFCSNDDEVLDFLHNGLQYFRGQDTTALKECPRVEKFFNYGVVPVGDDTIGSVLDLLKREHIPFAVARNAFIVDCTDLKRIHTLRQYISFIVDSNHLAKLDSVVRVVYRRAFDFQQEFDNALLKRQTLLQKTCEQINESIANMFISELFVGDIEPDLITDPEYEFLGKADKVSTFVFGNRVPNVFLTIGNLNPRLIFLETVEAAVSKLVYLSIDKHGQQFQEQSSQ